jgi:hypothetical protein
VFILVNPNEERLYDKNYKIQDELPNNRHTNPPNEVDSARVELVTTSVLTEDGKYHECGEVINQLSILMPVHQNNEA